MLTIALHDDASAAVAAMPERVREALLVKANALAADLQAKIGEKLSGRVLNAKSGALARSIGATITESATSITVRIATSAVKYAAIQEFGGTITPHQIVPDKAKALAFATGGKQVFAACVNLPAITIPERSYMRSSLAEMANEITDAMSAAIIEATR